MSQVMQMVIDTNYLRDSKLEKYLLSSKTNFAVLTDYSAIEAYKSSNPILTILESMKILAKFPKQVIVLKGTIDCCGIISKHANSVKLFIDSDQTSNYSSFYSNVILATNGDKYIESQLIENSLAAKVQMKKMLQDSTQLLDALTEATHLFRDDQVAKIRKDIAYQDIEIMDQLIHNALLMSKTMFSAHPKVNRIPSFKELPNTFIFRQSLCAQALLINWISTGSQPNVHAKHLLNDLVDINFAAYALYFDGILTNENKLNLIYNNSKLLLNFFKKDCQH